MSTAYHFRQISPSPSLTTAAPITGTRAGRDHVWEIEPTRLDEARRWLEHITGQWDEVLDRLKQALEKEGRR